MISVIIPTYNNCGFLRTAIESLLTQDFNMDKFEILIIDNNSNDKTKELIDNFIRTKNSYNIKYYFEPIPGLISGRHRGLEEASGNILVFIDDDLEADKGWLKAVEESFTDPEVQLVGGKNLPKYIIEPPPWVLKLKISTPYGGWMFAQLSLLDLGDQVIEINPDFIWGLNFAIRKKALIELGGFHPDCIPKHLQHFQGDGESGLTHKAKLKNYNAIYNPKMLVHHVIPSERLTPEYFEKRYFYQGVCDSFTAIRKQNGLYSEKVHTKQIISFLKTLKRYAKRFLRIVFPIQDKIDFEYSNLLKRFDSAYKSGYIFHQNAFKKNKLVKQWVLRANYLDYRLPEND